MPRIIGTAQDVTRGLFADKLTFENLSVPVADGDRVTCSALTEVIPDDDGEFDIELAPGRYKLTASGKTRSFPIPEGAATYSLADLLRAAAETPLPWLKNADTIDDLKAIRYSANLRLAYCDSDSNGLPALYRRIALPGTEGDILSDDGLFAWARISLA